MIPTDAPTAATALVAGLIPVFNHVLYPNSNTDIVPMINNAFPQISLILVAIVGLLLILGLFGMQVKGAPGWFANVIIFGAIIAVVVIFGSSAGLGWWNLPYWARSWLNAETISIIVAILIFAIVVGYITGDDKDKKERDLRSREFRENPGKSFGLGGIGNN